MGIHITEEEEFFNYIHDKIYRSLYLYAASKCNNSQDIEDVLQETFQEAFVQINRVRKSDKPEGFIMNILKYKLMKLQERREKDGKVLTAVCSAPGTGTKPEQKEIWDFCKSHLKQKDYLIIRYRYFEGVSFAEIAVRLGLSEAACKMRVKRSLEKLKKLLIASRMSIN